MKFAVIIIGLLILLGCQGNTEEFILKGEFIGAPENEWVYLMDARQRIYFDSVQLSRGQFEFRGKVETPELRSIVFFKDPSRRKNGWAKIMSIPIYLENSKIKVTVPFGEMPSKLSKEMPQSLCIEGSESHDLYRIYQKQIEPLSISYQKTFDLYRKAYYRGQGSEEDVFHYIKQLEVIEDETYQCGIHFIREHGDSPVALYVARELDVEQKGRVDIPKVVELFPVQVRNSEDGKKIEQLLTGKSLYLNDLLPDIEVVDVDLQQKKLLEVVKKGRYTLVELWASWCAPCRADIPHLKETYKRFHKKGFDIVSISIDEDWDKWKKALADEGMTWMQVCGGLKAQKTFGVSGVPSGFLVDPEGKIVHLNARGGWLNLYLYELFEK